MDTTDSTFETDSKNKNICVIDLERVYENLPNQDWQDNSTRPHRRRTPSPLHQDQAAQLTAQVWNSLMENVDSARENWVNGWTNLNYFISGGRGSGKSTFLRYVARCITNQEHITLPEKLNTRHIPAIHNLFFCDPTAMSSQENFFVSIVSAIRDLVKRNTGIRTQRVNHVFTDEGAHQHGENNGAHSHQFFINMPGKSDKDIIDQIYQLSRGITLLEDSYNSPQSDLDPESQFQIGLLNSNKALNLKRNFDDIINQVAQYYNLDGFLISIDDADIECTKNLKIIEIIRTYLTHPRIIILFTGDQILTHETIRQKQFKQFSLDFHKEDEENKLRRMKLTNDMAAQYLKKIFPVANHVALYTLQEAIENKKATYILRFHKSPLESSGERNEAREELKTFVQDVFRYTISHTPHDTGIFVEAFLRLPLRSILLTLRYWNDHGVHEIIKRVREEYKNEQRPPHKELTTILANSFRFANYNELMSKGFTHTEMVQDSIFILSKSVLRHCITSGNLIYGYHLATNATRFNNQESALTLASKAANILKTYGDCFLFSLFSAFTAKVFKHYQQNTLTTEGRQSSTSYDSSRSTQYSQFVQNRFTDYLFSNNSDNAIRWAKKISLICICNDEGEEKNASYIDKGVIHLSHLADAKLISLIFKDLADKIDSNKGSFDTFLAYMTMVILCGQTNGPYNIYYLSAFIFMGFMARSYTLLKDYSAEERQKMAEDMINKMIERFIQTNVEPSWSNSSHRIPSNIHISRHVPSEKNRKKHVEALAEKLVKWVQELDTPCPLRAPDVGRIADTLYQTISDVSNDLSAHLNSPYALQEEFPNIFPKLLSRLELFFDYNATKNKKDNVHDYSNSEFVKKLQEFPIFKEIQSIINELKTCVTKHWPTVEDNYSTLKEINNLYTSAKKLQDDIHTTKERIRLYFLPKYADDDSLRDSNIGKLHQIEDARDAHKACAQAYSYLASIAAKAQSIEADIDSIVEMNQGRKNLQLQSSLPDWQETAAISKNYIKKYNRRLDKLRQDTGNQLIKKLEEYVSRKMKLYDKIMSSYHKECVTLIPSFKPYTQIKPDSLTLERLNQLATAFMRFYSRYVEISSTAEQALSEIAEQADVLAEDEYITEICRHAGSGTSQEATRQAENSAPDIAQAQEPSSPPSPETGINPAHRVLLRLCNQVGIRQKKLAKRFSHSKNVDGPFLARHFERIAGIFSQAIKNCTSEDSLDPFNSVYYIEYPYSRTKKIEAYLKKISSLKNELDTLYKTLSKEYPTDTRTSTRNFASTYHLEEDFTEAFNRIYQSINKLPKATTIKTIQEYIKPKSDDPE